MCGKVLKSSRDKNSIALFIFGLLDVTTPLTGETLLAFSR